MKTDNIQVLGNIAPGYDEILTPEAQAFVAQIARRFEGRRQKLLQMRVARQIALDQRETPDFLPETRAIREADWSIAPLPADLQDRRVEITGPVERKMMINALNSGAQCFMADFEDSNTPSWDNQIKGQINVRDAYRRTISYTSETGKEYALNDKIATLIIRPRGWHLPEKHMLVDNEPVSGALFDFALTVFHNLREQQARGSSCYFYLPKMESHLEARLWNEVFTFAEETLGVTHGAIKATVLIETILAAFEMEEILYELKDHSAGLNAGRWDYIFSCIKKFKRTPGFCLAERNLIGMTVPFMRAYSLLLLKTCHRRNAPAIGGMSAFIPIKNDPVANEKALSQVKADKERDANDGYDGGWVAHPGLVPIATAAWDKVMPTPNQIHKRREDIHIEAADLLRFQPESPITEQGLRTNISVGIQYLGSWLNGNGCVPINNLMEDAATAEISRSQIWQWIHSDKGRLEDGTKITVDLVRKFISEEFCKTREHLGKNIVNTKYEAAVRLFEDMTTQSEFVEFLTIPGYAYLDVK